MHYKQFILQYQGMPLMFPELRTITIIFTNPLKTTYFQYFPPNSPNLQITPYNKRYTALLRDIVEMS